MIQKIVIAIACFHVVAGDFVFHETLPDTVNECFENAKKEPVNFHRAQRACMLAYYTEVLQPQNLTDEDKRFFAERQNSRFMFTPPKTGFRLRREIRTLSKEERQRFFKVLQTMYKEGTIQKFGRLHGQTRKKVHKGAAFLPWHRVFILDFEEEMRRIDERVFLPYWDYTIDNNITKPSDSVVWSDCFFGNGEGFIKTGPFRNWYGGHSIQMQRDYARGGQCPPRLINKLDINRIMKKCHFTDVTTGSEPFYDNINNIEMLHDGVHDWVGGDMDELPFAAFDPVFYLHHAFIDYIWEKFRNRQRNSCHINPETDWRPKNDLCQIGREDHGAFDTMFGYPHLRNIDGAWNNMTQYFYNYEEQPECPHCSHSEYLYCDTKVDSEFPEGICLTKTKDVCESGESILDNESERGTQWNLDNRPVPFTVERIKGMSGDGRSRDMSFEDSFKVLQSEIGKGTPRNKTGHMSVTAKNALLFHYTVKTSGDKHDDSKYNISLHECTKGCLGLTVIGVACIALLFCTIVGLLFKRF
ncbi:putative tyrosinase-like protein tyr-3 isoform X2 [Ruditapes philippinarum]|uniref:putative tyrosinase-like protein tyr-3 isoform X2 n=1 Tax=Ruditapes philippinarum TaxID=129788 RepID=UPI00295AE15A|nr:putative tyrosinase-like protein tyr-3 isoform X2 [Ruditapes philippinarum]